jgi:hypothetical protein
MQGSQKPGWKQHLITFVIVFAIIGMLLNRSRGCRPGRPPSERPPAAHVADLKIGRWRVRAEVADTVSTRERGLAGRARLDRGYGMLYVFEQPQNVTFWSKDNAFAVSLAFLRPDGAIARIADLQANSPVPVESGEPVLFALEVRQGWFADRGLTAGARVEVPESVRAAALPAADTEIAPGAPAAPEGAGAQ